MKMITKISYDVKVKLPQGYVYMSEKQHSLYVSIYDGNLEIYEKCLNDIDEKSLNYIFKVKNKLNSVCLSSLCFSNMFHTIYIKCNIEKPSIDDKKILYNYIKMIKLFIKDEKTNMNNPLYHKRYTPLQSVINRYNSVNSSIMYDLIKYIIDNNDIDYDVKDTHGRTTLELYKYNLYLYNGCFNDNKYEKIHNLLKI